MIWNFFDLILQYPFLRTASRALAFSVLLASPVFADWDDDDDDEWEDDDEEEYVYYHETPSKITYGGMTIQCHWGCGEFYDPNEYGSHLEQIAYILRNFVSHAFQYASPICFRYGYLDDPIVTWDYNDGQLDVYDWPAANGFYVSDYPRKKYSFETHSQFLELASALRRDLRFYDIDVRRKELNIYQSALPILQEKLEQKSFQNVLFYENGQLEFLVPGYTTEYSKDISTFTRDLEYNIKRLQDDLSSYYPERYENRSEKLEKAIREIDTLYHDLFVNCLYYHQPEGIAFNGALEEFLLGDYEQAIQQIQRLIQIAEEQNLTDDLLAKLYLLKGQIQSESCLYADAIIGLTTAIQKNPALKEAYFERAAAYFELGNFDQAIEDYLASEMRPSPWLTTEFGLGIGVGTLQGASTSLEEFIPSLLGTLRGLSNGIWAFSQNPAGVTQEFATAAVECVEYIKSHTSAEIVQEMVPELKHLVQNYDTLNDFDKGKLIGHVIGKYGVDILSAKYGIEGLKILQNLKNANKVMTLEALASPATTQIILKESAKRWAVREQTLANGNLKIQLDKQEKHLEGHRNYIDLINNGKNPSVFIHPEPNRLISEYAGTGIREKGNLPGMPGYVEIVNFEEFIGYSVDIKTGQRFSTSRGKIHYASDGVHIVPTKPE